MYRIKCPKASLDFYTRVMGMCLLKQFHFDEMKFELLKGYNIVGDGTPAGKI